MATAPPEKSPKPGLNIYGFSSVNPYKLTIAAEELGIPYNYINLDMPAGEPKLEWYTAINPNGRLPAIIHVKDDGTSVTIFESGACLLYLVSEFDKENKLSYPPGTQEYWTQTSWLAWQIAGYGPMMGQGAHFNRYSPQPEPYGSWRYTAECRRLNSVLDKHLASSKYIAGDRLTISDIAIFIFTHSCIWCGVDINEWPHAKEWCERLAQRPAFKKGLECPVTYPFSDAAVSSTDNLDWYKSLRKNGTQFIKGASESWKGEVVKVPSDHANHG
jgi:glutathione S-transferase